MQETLNVDPSNRKHWRGSALKTPPLPLRAAGVVFAGMISFRAWLDVPVAKVPTTNGERELTVDLYCPEGGEEPFPLVVYIHGGGWRQGIPYRPPLWPRLLDDGIGIAAITYRFSGEAPFPACLADCRLMIRWLRAHSATYGWDPERLGAWGISAGGHLVSLVGSPAAADGTGESRPWNDYSSEVRAVCNCCGPADLWRTATDAVPGEEMIPMVSDLLGGPLRENREKAVAASPVSHVTAGTAPHLLVHGEEDSVVPAYHSKDLHSVLREKGIDSELIVLPGIGHSIPPEEWAEPVRSFFVKHLLAASANGISGGTGR